MYIVDAFWSIVPGSELPAVQALQALADEIRANEPDTWMYLIHSPNLDPSINIYPPPAPVQVAFVEGYKDRDAFLAHHNGPALKNFVAQNGKLFLNMYGPTAPWIMAQAMELGVGFIR